MDFQQSAVPFPLATVGLASPREEAEGASDAFQLPAITRPRPHLQHKPSQPARNSSFTQLHAAAPLSRRPSVVNNQSFFEGVEFATRVCTSRRPESRTASRQNSQTGQLRSPLTPLRRTLADEEEGFLSDGEDDMPLWSDDYDHFQQESNFSFEEDADGSPRIFEEGDRVGVGMHHHGSLAKDCFAHPVDKSARRLEIIRKLGSGSYAVVYLARAVLWDPDVDGIDSEDGEAGLEFGQEVVYGQEFALKCLCKQNLSDELLEVQRFEVSLRAVPFSYSCLTVAIAVQATLHQKVPSHPNIVEMHGVSDRPK